MAIQGERVSHQTNGSGTIVESKGSTVVVKFDSGVVTEVASASVSTILHS